MLLSHSGCLTVSVPPSHLAEVRQARDDGVHLFNAWAHGHYSDRTSRRCRSCRRSCRPHSAEFNARVIELALQLGTSVAAVALANGLNAYMLRRWVHEAAANGEVPRASSVSAAPTLASFVQLPMHQPEPHTVLYAQPAPASSPPPEGIMVEIHRGGTTVHAKLPMDDRSAACLREVLG